MASRRISQAITNVSGDSDPIDYAASMESDSIYFRRRAEEEFAAAKLAAGSDARTSHSQLGERYVEFAEAIDSANRRIGPLP